MTARFRWRNDEGTGVLSASLGITFFLVFLLLSTQLAADLFATSALRSDVVHAAHGVVSDRVLRGGQGAMDAEMQRQNALLTSRYQKGDPHITWQHDDPDWLVLTVTVDSPSHLASPVRDVLHMDTITATSRVRIEQPQ